MKITGKLVHRTVIAMLGGLVWWAVMFLPLPDAHMRLPGEPPMARDVSYGRPWKFGVDMSDVAGGYPCSIDLWKPWAFVGDGLVWAAIVGCGAVVLYFITKAANPDG